MGFGFYFSTDQEDEEGGDIKDKPNTSDQDAQNQDIAVALFSQLLSFRCVHSKISQAHKTSRRAKSNAHRIANKLQLFAVEQGTNKTCSDFPAGQAHLAQVIIDLFD